VRAVRGIAVALRSRIMKKLALALLSLAACVGDLPDGVQTPNDPPINDNTPTPTPPPTGGSATPTTGFVLAHGLAGDANSFDPAIVTALQAAGYAVIRTQVPGVDSIATRAAALEPQIDKFISDNQLAHVHVIAHSMGGLDARYLISTMHYDKVESLTTMSTPHRGSPIADAALGLSDQLPDQAVAALSDALGFTADPAALHRALVDLSEAQAPAFNAANPDSPAVRYYSYAGYATVDGVTNPNASDLCGATTPDPSSLPTPLDATAAIIASDELRPHDGVVPIDSSKWTGFSGCIPTDHLDMTRAGEEPASDLALDLVKLYTGIAALRASQQ
jgi:triacylglycerol lipase